MEQAPELARAGGMDTLYREDMRETAPARRRVTRTRWMVLRGELENAGTPASRRLYTHAQARRFVRLARRLGHDVYCARFGRVDLEIGRGAQ